MYCTHCGKECNNHAVVCVGCGVPIEGANFGNAQRVGVKTIPSPDDSGGFLWGFLGFILSFASSLIVPIILVVVWRDEYPKRTNAIIKGIIADVIFTVLMVMIVLLIVFVAIFIYSR